MKHRYLTRQLFAIGCAAMVAFVDTKPVLGFGETHLYVNERIYGLSVIDEYFSEELKVPVDANGRITQTYREALPFHLFQQAGTAEDDPWTRAWNHFHDPLRDWDHAGYTKPLIPDGISSIAWAQYGMLQNAPWTLWPNNEWNWHQAYAYFRDGLADPNPAVRDLKLADLFTALGHLTHLVADASVPDHTRNDTHLPIFRNYETWCAGNLRNANATINGVPVFRYAFGPERAIFVQDRGRAFGSEPLSLVSNLWDSEVAAGYNPRLGVSERLVGLADYSNYNYFSGDTVFQTYQHPSRNEVGLTLLPTPGPSGEPDYLLYFNRTASDGVFVEHLAAAGMFYSELQEMGYLDLQIAHLDNLCYQDYASNLVPRAVSYGTELVNYFFRVKLNVTAQGTTLRVENQYPGRISGAVTVYADINGTRRPVDRFENILLELGAAGSATAAVTWSGFTPPVTEGLRYLLVFSGSEAPAGTSGQGDSVVAARSFPWVPQVLPATVPMHSSRLVVRSYMVPYIRNDRLSQPLAAGNSLGCSCHYVHGSTYPTQLGDDMTNLELCKNCHGSSPVGNHAPTWAPPRILVSPDAVPPELVPAMDVTTFNPKPGETVSGLVQFLPAVLDATHRTQSPIKFRMEVWDSGGTHILGSVPEGPFEDLVSGWRWATALWFLRDWVYTERLVWNSAAVPNGTYLFRFYPMSNPDYFNNPLRVGLPAELLLSVQNSPGI